MIKLLVPDDATTSLTEPVPRSGKPFNDFTPTITRGTLEDLMLDPKGYHPLGAVEIFRGDEKLEPVSTGSTTIQLTRVVYDIYGGFGTEEISTLPRFEETQLFDSLQALNEALKFRSYVLTKFDEKNRYYNGTSSTHYVGDLYVKRS